MTEELTNLNHVFVKESYTKWMGAETSLWTNCDENDMKNITTSNIDAVKMVTDIRVVEYDMVDKLLNPKRLGFVGQEVSEIFPNVVGDNYSVSFGKLVPLLLKAIQQQQQKINVLEEQMNKLIG